MQISRRRLVQMSAGGVACMATGAMAADGPINETGFRKIGGIDQWIAIQGQDSRNPVILYLHGGPGEAQSPFLNQFKRWEKDFTVVNWDQRGAGKTYEKNGEATPDFGLDRVIDDAIELTEHVLKKLGKAKLILVGQSAGTALGLKVAQRRLDLYYAYVGTAQLVNVIHIAEWQEKIADVPRTHDAAEMKALHQWAIKSPPDQPYMDLMTDYMGSPEHPKPDAVKWLAGYNFEAGKIGREIQAFDAMTNVPELAVPYILIQGREDRITPTVIAKAYFDQIRSKGKAFVEIEGGHYACFTNASAFVAALAKYVRPLAV
jgi:pimeloyl-ACP methyl ester carboxylesterase